MCSIVTYAHQLHSDALRQIINQILFKRIILTAQKNVTYKLHKIQRN